MLAHELEAHAQEAAVLDQGAGEARAAAHAREQEVEAGQVAVRERVAAAKLWPVPNCSLLPPPRPPSPNAVSFSSCNQKQS